MAIVDRAKNIILKPAEEWNVIAAEPETVGNLFTSYAAILALIPAIIGLLASLLIGALLSQYMGGIMPALTTTALISQTISGYFIGLLLVFAMGHVINAISPSFNGRQDIVQSMKLIVYSSTATWVASLLLIIPVLGFLAYFGGIAYAIYLLYLGLSPVLNVPKEKVAGMTVVVVLAYIVIAVILTIVQNLLIGFGSMNGALPGA